MSRTCLTLVISFVALLARPLSAADPPPVEAPEKPLAAQEELEKQFAETLSGASLVGHFTVTGQDFSKPLKEDRYTLSKVSKTEDGRWLFKTRIQYGEHNVEVPLLLHVKWAGDTPVITLSDTTIPLLGTFTARVLFNGGQYAGTWSAGKDHEGQLFGRIVKEEAHEGNGEAKPAKTTAKGNAAKPKSK